MAKIKSSKSSAKPKFSRVDKILDSAGWFSLIALGLITVFTYVRSTDIIPLHYNVVGHADGFGKKIMIFAVLAIAAAIFLCITLSIKFVFDPSKATIVPNKNFDFAIRTIRFIRLVAMLGFIYILVVTNLVVDGHVKGLGSLFLPIVMVSLLFPIAFYFKRTLSPRNKR